MWRFLLLFHTIQIAGNEYRSYKMGLLGLVLLIYCRKPKDHQVFFWFSPHCLLACSWTVLSIHAVALSSKDLEVLYCKLCNVFPCGNRDPAAFQVLWGSFTHDQYAAWSQIKLLVNHRFCSFCEYFCIYWNFDLNLTLGASSPTFLEPLLSDSLLIFLMAALVFSLITISKLSYGWELWVEKFQFGRDCSHWRWTEKNVTLEESNSQIKFRASCINIFFLLLQQCWSCSIFLHKSKCGR